MPIKTIPSADPFDTDTFPFGKHAGSNKFNFFTCPTCHKSPTHPTTDQYGNRPIPPEGFYMFRNELSAREYAISAMCQACQDSVFGED